MTRVVTSLEDWIGLHRADTVVKAAELAATILTGYKKQVQLNNNLHIEYRVL